MSTSEEMVVQILSLAQTLIRDPKKWTQRAFARDWQNNGVWPISRNAEQWCAVGAVFRAGHQLGVSEELVGTARTVLRDSVLPRSVTIINDVREHGDVMEMFDAAIRMAASKVETFTGLGKLQSTNQLS